MCAHRTIRTAPNGERARRKALGIRIPHLIRAGTAIAGDTSEWTTPASGCRCPGCPRLSLASRAWPNAVREAQAISSAYQCSAGGATRVRRTAGPRACSHRLRTSRHKVRCPRSGVYSNSRTPRRITSWSSKSKHERQPPTRPSGRWQPLTLPGTVLTVDTTDFAAASVPEIAALVAAHIGARAGTAAIAPLPCTAIESRYWIRPDRRPSSHRAAAPALENGSQRRRALVRCS
jgi:hypothetical protein